MAKSALISTSMGVGLATGLYGISFGALSVASGLDVLQTQVLSLLMFSGGSQFAFIGVIAASGIGGVGVGAAIVSAWLLGIRNGFYAVRMAPILNRIGLAKLLPALLTIDESTAVAAAQADEGDQKKGFWYTGLAVFVFWNIATLIGAFLGDAIGDPKAWGLDAAAAAAFLGLIWPRLVERQSLAVAAIAMVIAVSLTPALPAGVPVLVAGAVAIAFGALNLLAVKVK